MARTGRPRIEIDWKDAERLCAIQCTEREIADFFGISIDTLDRRLRKEKGMTFRKYFDLYRTNGKISLRRNLFRLSATQGHVAIFLAKNWLGMVDNRTLEGNPEKPLIPPRVIYTDDMSKLSKQSPTGADKP